mmetsp:Transcript_42797/g.138825  ORF Transcript_42797/g.138825 Transcript_42797/m.138825 type:complete len:244 (+) Transcript_42797:339-1070(+)
MRASPANRQYAPRTRSHHATVPGGVERGPACLVLRVDTTVATDMAVPLHYLPRRQTAVVMAIDDGHVLQHDWSRAQPAVTPVSECPVMAERPSFDGHVLVKVAPIAVDACWVGLVRAGHARDAHIRLVALEQRAKYHYGVRRRYNVILKKDRRRMVCKRRIKDLKPRDADANIHRVSVQRWPLVKRRRQRGRQRRTTSVAAASMSCGRATCRPENALIAPSSTTYCDVWVRLFVNSASSARVK